MKTRPMIRTALLGVELHAARCALAINGRTLSFARAAEHFGVHANALHGWESAKRTPMREDVSGALGAYGVVGEHRERILSLARLPDTDSVLLGRRGRPRHLATADVCALHSTSIVDWHPLLIPELLRTTKYAHAVATDVLPETIRPETDRTFSVEDAARLATTDVKIYIGEHAILNLVGGQAVARDQLGYLLKLIQTNPVGLAIRIVPAVADVHVGLAGPFTVYNTYAGRIVYRGHGYCGSFTLAQPDDPYAVADPQLSRLALGPSESVDFIADHVGRLGEAACFGDRHQLTS